MLAELITGYVLEKTLDSALTKIKKILVNVKSSLQSDKHDIQDALSSHMRLVTKWCTEISFSDLRGTKHINQVFVELDIYLMPRRLRIQANEKIKSIPLQHIFNYAQQHLILVGHPGAGKTTSMKFLCTQVLFESDFYRDRFNAPIIVRLRELNLKRDSSDKDPISSLKSIVFKHLYQLLGISVELDKKFLDNEPNQKEDNSENRIQLIEDLVITLLDELKILLILDGFDEITLSSHRDIVLSEIRKLTSELSQATVVVTSRTGEFPYHIEHSDQFEICPLSNSQIRQFATKWLEDEAKINKFLTEIAKSPFKDAMIRPLTIAHLCAIFERSGQIPEKPKSVYRKIVNLLLEEWDEQRSVRRMSKYASFEIDRKSEFLSALAYNLTIMFDRNIFAVEHLHKVYEKIYFDFDLLKDEATKVVSELESHNGLFIEVGYETYEFAHKSLQEFLSADYIVKLPRIPHSENVLRKLSNELAIAITISSSPSNYFVEFVLNILVRCRLPRQFYESFIDRLLQEKPDFNSNEDVTIALAVLYSLYLDRSIIQSEQVHQMSLFYEDNLTTQFEDFVMLLLKRNPTKALAKFYKKMNEFESTSGTETYVIYTLSRNEKHSRYSIPEFLYIRETFFNR